MREYDLDTSIWDIIVELFYNGLYIYSIFIMTAYLVLAMVSFRSVKLYLHKTNFIDYKDILNTPLAPGISLVAPAYNEGTTIIENIRSLLSLHYSRYEVIIVNDGSKDDTLDKVIQEYEMEKVDYCINPQLHTKDVRGVYKSRNKSYRNLILVDKENGGKSDALNCGMNVSNYDYVTCIDVDCVLEQDSLLKLMKPFTDETDAEIIATGGVIRIANSCKVVDGRLIDVNIPKNFLARTQALEYIRAFLLGRMAWSLLDGLILISGAMGVFKKEIVIEVGGYDHKTVGEDMELVVRMRRFMRNHKRKYHVAYVPDPLCWTEVPESWKLLGRQRNRWTRGTIETLLKHKVMFMNPRHGLIGMVSFPYWVFFEWLAPLLEALGLSLFFLMAIVGLVNWSFFFLMLFLVYGFTLCFSVLSLLIEEITFHQYKRHSEVFRLLFVGIIEPLFFHPWIVYAAVKGNFDYMLGKTAWGDMARKGFAYGSRQKPKRINVVRGSYRASATAIKNAQLGTKIVGAVGIASILVVGYFVYKGISEENFPKPEIMNRAEVYTLDEYDDKETSELVLLEGTEESAYHPKSKIAREEFKKGKIIEDEPQDKTVEEGGGVIVKADNEGLAAPSQRPKASSQQPTANSQQPPAKSQQPAANSQQPPAKSRSSLSGAERSEGGNQKPESKSKFKLVYHLIAGSFSSEKNAKELQQELLDKGYKSEVVTAEGNYRVTYGAFQLKDEAYALRTMLQRQGKAQGAWVYTETGD